MEAKAPEQPREHIVQDELPVLLVVDDDPDILRVVRFYLTKQRYRVHTAESGQEALDLLDTVRNVELILSDVMMPGMSGLDLLVRVREHSLYSDVPVILISAEGETSKKVTGLNLGADDFITKPFNFDELMARVQNHIRLRRLQKEVMIANREVSQANAMLRRQNDRFQDDLDAARSLQMTLLPDQLPSCAEYNVGARYLPADRVGGDLFDVVRLSGQDRMGIFIADVCGHGVAAAIITAMTKITFQSAWQRSDDPAVVLGRMNRNLSENLNTGFVTVFYGVYDAEQRTLAYASGGHPPLLVHKRDGGRIEALEPQETFLGCFSEVTFRTDTTVLEPGDRVLFYTDGLFESARAEGEEFGMDRVRERLLANAKRDLQPTLDTLLGSLNEFMGGTPFDDDITMVGLDVLA